MEENLFNGGMELVPFWITSTPKQSNGGINKWTKCLIWVSMASNVMGQIL